MQFGETLVMKEEKKVRFAFFQRTFIFMPSFLQTTHSPFINTPTLSISEFRREGEAGRAGKDRTLKLKVFSLSL